MGDCNNERRIKKFQLDPPRKKRRFSTVIGEEKKEIDNELESTTTDNKLVLDKSDKFKYFGSGKVIKGDKILDIMSIRTEIYDLCNTSYGVNKVLSMYFNEMKERALGCNIIYAKKYDKRNNKVVMVRQPVFSHIEWAQSVKSDGGGGTQYTVIEKCALINSCGIVAENPVELACKPVLGITNAANIGKVYRIYICVVFILKLGFRFAEFVKKRSQESVVKKVKGWMNKKSTDPDSIKVRTIFSHWGTPENVVRTS